MSCRTTSYTADFKRQVVLFAEASNDCAAQRTFDVNEKLIRGWRKQRDRLFASGHGDDDELERELRLYVLDERAKGLPVTYEDIQVKAQQLARRDGRPALKASRGWVQRFMRRNDVFSQRRRSATAAATTCDERVTSDSERYATELGRDARGTLCEVGDGEKSDQGLPADNGA